jgi:hypothetical protein
MKMKSALILSFNGWAKIDENVIVFVTHDVIHGPIKHHVASYST